jgi:hypothetical protein
LRGDVLLNDVSYIQPTSKLTNFNMTSVMLEQIREEMKGKMNE